MKKRLSISATAVEEAKSAPVADHVFLTNHSGDLDITHQLIDLAQDAGRDAVKFQKRTVEVVYTDEFLASP